MNKDQVKAVLNGVLGSVQEHAGKTLGSRQLQAKGVLRKGRARLQKACADVKDALKHSRHS